MLYLNNHLNKWEIECPYCRKIQSGLLPYINIEGVTQITGVNSPKGMCMYIHKCSVCNIPSHDNLCPEHYKQSILCNCETKQGNRCKNKQCTI